MPGRPAWGRLLGLVGAGGAVVLAVTLGPGARVGAQATPSTPTVPVTTTPTPEVNPRLAEAAIRVSRRTADRLDSERAIAETDARILDADAEITAIDQRLAVARAARDRVEARLGGRAVIAYQLRGEQLQATLNLTGVRDLAASAQYADAVAAVDARDLARYQEEVDRLEARRAELVNEREELVRRRLRLDADLRAALDDLARDGAVIDRLGGLTVMGESRLSAEQIAGWFRSHGRTTVLAGSTTIEDLVGIFLAEASAEGVRGDLAFAQAVLETGWFAHAGDNNFSGLGACDSCNGDEIRFPTPTSGVRAQMQLLRNYADPSVRAERLAHAPEPALYGTDPIRAATTYDAFGPRGRAPAWQLMGGGNWATDPGYAGKVLGIYGEMLAWAGRPA